MSEHIEKLLASKKVVFLQGPMGTFYNRVAKWLQSNGIETYKINFNGGDWFFTQNSAYNYRKDYLGKIEDFAWWFEEFMLENHIDSVICFGDCRRYHQDAKKVTFELGRRFFVFEEGYIRPDYITFESYGVNANSRLKIDFTSLETQQYDQEIVVKKANNRYELMVFSAISYFVMKVLMMPKYRHYKHHRNLSIQTECLSWITSAYRRIKNDFTEPKPFEKFLKQYAGQYFVFPLQVHNDSQILVHSELKDMEKYIEHVIASFSHFAKKEHHLVLKHHPMDRGYRHYAKLIQELSIKYECEGRTHYFCDIHLPSLLKNSLGLVTVNSTTGIQALHHSIPVKVLAKAIYNMPGLTYQNNLDSFWQTNAKVCKDNLKHFKYQLIKNSQLNGAFYGDCFWILKR